LIGARPEPHNVKFSLYVLYLYRSKVLHDHLVNLYFPLFNRKEFDDLVGWYLTSSSDSEDAYRIQDVSASAAVGRVSDYRSAAE
jgi:hypothetical protein